MKPLTVLSLFDGIGCGYIALRKSKIPICQYYASEIDQYAIRIASCNYPDIVQLGDVLSVKGNRLPKIDLLIGGSPCQGFSFAGTKLNFAHRSSRLFFEYVRLLSECQPRYFLLENVKMCLKYQDVISECLGVKPIQINSALVSAQHRVRLYWTNIPYMLLPLDRGLLLRDILIPDVPYKQADRKDFIVQISNHKSTNGFLQVGGITKKTEPQIVPKNFCHGYKIFDIHGKCPTLIATGGGRAGYGNVLITDDISKLHYRRLLPIECERLQNIPDNYTYGIPTTQRHKTIGNAWTVDVISHILQNIGG